MSIRNHCVRPFKWLRLRLLLLLMLGLSGFCPSTDALEAKWTPNEEDSGPLPLSMQQRQQLLKLENAIRSSPNPEETLQRAADANQMDPAELWDMLSRNRQDLEASGSLTDSSPAPRNAFVKLLASLGAIFVNVAKRNPKSFALTATSLVCILFVLISVPRTGIVLSNQRNLISGGPTTIMAPPAKYVLKIVENMSEPSVKSQSLPDLSDILQPEPDAIWHKFGNQESSTLKSVASMQATIDAVDFIDDADDGDNDDLVENVQEILLEHASQIMVNLELTEFVTPSNRLRLVTVPGARKAALVSKGMGDFGRFGIQPLRVTAMDTSVDDETNQEEVSLTLSTIKGGHFDGFLRVSVSSNGSGVNLRTSIFFTKKGTKISKSLALRAVSMLNDSILASIKTRARQSFARMSQSSRLSGSAQRQASKRRNMRFFKEKAMEEMATERRRRWQRSNPNSGNYRPSGDRMRSPNNAVY